MGTSIKIQDTNLDITKFQCSQCHQAFTQQDKKNDNWDVWWDTSNEVETNEYGENGFVLSIWVKAITHKFTSGEFVNGNPWSSYGCPEEAEKEVSHE